MQQANNSSYKNDYFLFKINHYDEKYVSPIAKSSSIIRPGDVLRFFYSYLNKSGVLVTGFYHVLVVNPGRYNHPSTGNNLMTCYKLDDAAETVLKTALSYIYNMKKPEQQKFSVYRDRENLEELQRKPYLAKDDAVYKELLRLSQSLTSMFGMSSYRTFDMKKIRGGIEKVNINPSKLQEEVEDFMEEDLRLPTTDEGLKELEEADE